jgi:arginyl-tRNA synthetase
MIQQALVRALSDAVAAAAPDLGLPADELPVPELQRPRQKEHGDWATNVALIIAPRVEGNPRAVAEALVSHFPPTDLVDSVEVAGPGFINIRLHHRWLHEVLRAVLEAGDAYGTRDESRGLRANVEFVSANPTGPLHVGHARNTVLGDALANILAADGYGVEREYYWNDTGTQMELLGESIEARYLVRFGVAAEVPENGYQGDYVDVVAGQIADDVGDVWVKAEPAKRRLFFEEEGRARMVAWVRSTLERFGVHFDTWFSEATLEEGGAIQEAVELLRASGHAYESEGAVWFRSTEFGDDKDRVLVRSNGQPTYFAKDVAYMRNKFARGFDRLVYVWGADHHGDLKRMRGVAQAMGYDLAALEFVLYQFVSLSRGGEPVRMSKRAGDLVTLDELVDEVGVDAARYTLLARSPDSPIDFDIVEVARKSMDNPVYYVQYAHARIASLLRVARERGESPPPWQEVSFEELTEEAELDLLRGLSELPETIELSADGLAPHRLARYTEEVAALFHRFYTECRVITEDTGRTYARLWLCAGTKHVLASALRLLGVSAPESMERLWDEHEED